MINTNNFLNWCCTNWCFNCALNAYKIGNVCKGTSVLLCLLYALYRIDVILPFKQYNVQLHSLNNSHDKVIGFFSEKPAQFLV